MGRLVVTMGGLPNSGKSTIATILARTLDRTVRIELDGAGVGQVAKTLTQEERQALRDRDIHVEFEDASALAVNWLDRGFDVILVGLINEGATSFFQSFLDARVPDLTYMSIGLNPPLEIVLGPRGDRVPSDQERDYARSLATWYVPNGELIDNAGQTPEETASEIARILSKAR